MSTVTLHIEGMSCGHCLKAVRQALQGIPGATVDSVQMGRATLQTTAEGPTPEALAERVTAAGYSATAEVLDARHP